MEDEELLLRRTTPDPSSNRLSDEDFQAQFNQGQLIQGGEDVDLGFVKTKTGERSLNQKVQDMKNMLQQRAEANGISVAQAPPSLNPKSGTDKDGILDKLSFAVQNPMTAASMMFKPGSAGYIPSGAQKAVDAGGLQRNDLDSFGTDVINLPGAMTKLSEGLFGGDYAKAGKGLLYSLPYAKTISKAFGGINAVEKAGKAYKATANAITPSAVSAGNSKLLAKVLQKKLLDRS